MIAANLVNFLCLAHELECLKWAVLRADIINSQANTRCFPMD